MTMKKMIFPMALGLSLFSSASFANTNCEFQVARANPNYLLPDLQWLCGESTNTPVPGMGSNPLYVACLVEKIHAGVFDGNDLTSQCSTVSGRYSICDAAVKAANPVYSIADSQWLCGESTNSPVSPDKSQSQVYAQCLSQEIRSGVTDGNTLIGACSTVQGSYTACDGSVLGANSNYKISDAQWLCGESSNSPILGKAPSRAYNACLSQEIRSGMTDGNQLINTCRSVQDTGPARPRGPRYGEHRGQRRY
jgi:hypothetical protein